MFASRLIGCVDLVSQMDANPAHPWLWSDAPHPVRERRYTTEVFENMLFCDEPDGNGTASGIGNRDAKDHLGGKATFSMVAKSPMAEVRNDDLASIYPVMHLLIIRGQASELSR